MRRLLKIIIVVGILLFSPHKGFAIVVNPYKMGDPLRNLIGIVMSLYAQAHSPTVGAYLNVTQDEVEALLAGDESYVEDVGTGEAGPGLSTPTFSYISSKISSGQKTPYAPLNNKLTKGADVKAIVKEMFFIADAKEATDKKQEEVQARRTAYLTSIGKNYTRMAYEVQQQLISDMSAVSADINGNGSIGATAGLDQTWHAINRALIADIAMQIQLMELDAAKFLSVQPLVLMPETQPSTSTENEGGEA